MNLRVELPSNSWSMVLHILAADISGAISHEDKDTLLCLAGLLKEILLKRLRELKLDVSIPKCCNFLIGRMIAQMVQAYRASKRNPNCRLKKEKKE